MGFGNDSAKGITIMIKINESRIENGLEICNTCIRPVTLPWRIMIKDERGNLKVQFGCISKAHNGHVFDEWHLRAKKRNQKGGN